MIEWNDWRHSVNSWNQIKLIAGLSLNSVKAEILYYYNSKYIDAEETDVSRNQTSTWLMNSAEVVSKEEIYSSGIKVWWIAGCC